MDEMARHVGTQPRASYRLSSCGSSRETSARNTCDSLWEGLRRMYLAELYEHEESSATDRGEVRRHEGDAPQSSCLVGFGRETSARGTLAAASREDLGARAYITRSEEVV